MSGGGWVQHREFPLEGGSWCQSGAVSASPMLAPQKLHLSQIPAGIPQSSFDSTTGALGKSLGVVLGETSPLGWVPFPQDNGPAGHGVGGAAEGGGSE